MNVIEKLRESRAQLDLCESWFRDHHDLLSPIASEAFRLGGEAELCIGPDMTVRLSGDKHTLSQMVRALRTRGFTTDTKAPKANDSSWSAFFNHENIATGFVYLTFSSRVCRRVKVGTRVVPEHVEDVYEVVCGEQEIERGTTTNSTEAA